MNTENVKVSKITAIISLALIPGSFLMFILLGLVSDAAPDEIYLVMLGLAIAMQIASFVLGIIAVKLKPSGLSITALVISIVVIVLEVLYVAFTIWVIYMACNALMMPIENTDSEFWRMVDGCATMGFILGK